MGDGDFNLGDLVICVDDEGSYELSKHSVYKIRRLWRNQAGVPMANVELYDPYAVSPAKLRGEWCTHRFVLFRMFPGQKVVCRQGCRQGFPGGVSEGQEYTFVRYYGDYVVVKDDTGKELSGWYPWRFFPVNPDEMQKNVEDRQNQGDVPGGQCWSQYEIPPGAKQLQDLIEARGMNFAMGNIFKAVWRDGLKKQEDPLYDLRKIVWFANREIERRTKEAKIA